ncbi:hypothetical protein ABTW96_24385 [Nocardia beijingensis]|uniref:WXG100 family type VII secretion target n=1 Tax=Nocardia beijingensis TaxID=95162 RepID=UPI003332BFD6
MSGTQEYQAAAMTRLFDDLVNFHTELHTLGGDIHDAGQTLGQAWHGNQAHEQYHAAYSEWNTPYEDALHSLKRLAGAVENALHRALHTDHQIGQGFGGV